MLVALAPVRQGKQDAAMRCRVFGFTPGVLLAVLFGLGASNCMSQNSSSRIETWLGGSELPPSFAAPGDLQSWQTQRKLIRSQLWELLGKLPARPKSPIVHILSREDRGDYRVEKFTFDNGAGANVPGYILIPKGESVKRPGILYCHWHGGDYDLGKEAIFQARHTPEEPGPTLARQGFVVLGIDAYCFGERNGQGPSEERGGAGEMTASKFNLWVGRTLWGMILRDDLMALDYLLSRPEVDPNRVGATGISMGATRTWWLMALDERIKTGVAVACLTRYQDLIRAGELKAHGIYYFVPGMLDHFDTEAVISLIAPRPVLFMTGDQDGGSPPAGIRAIEEAVNPVYGLYGAKEQFVNEIYPGLGHVYTSEMWQKMLKWMGTRLQPATTR
jgi:dienelactone hydrolase